MSQTGFGNISRSSLGSSGRREEGGCFFASHGPGDASGTSGKFMSGQNEGGNMRGGGSAVVH